MRLTNRDLLSLARLDTSDVLSIYARTTPDRQVHSDPEWEVAIRSELRSLSKRVKDEGPRERRMALESRLGSLEAELDDFLDPSQPGRGRALFAPLDTDETRTVYLQMPLPDAVVLADRPYLRPLVAALDTGRPTGVLLVDRSGARLLEWAFGSIEDLAQFDFFEFLQGRRLEGPAMGNPARGQQSSTQRDRYDERRDEHVQRFLAGDVTEALRRRVDEHGWDRLVVVGPAPFTKPVADAFSDSLRVISSEQELMRSPATQVGEAASSLVEADHDAWERELSERIVETAPGGGHAAIGMADVLEALRDGRVRHLCFSDDLTASGFRTDGWVVHETSEDGLEAEPDLVERMVEKALDTGAQVTPVSGEAAEVLSPHDGVGALLRW